MLLNWSTVALSILLYCVPAVRLAEAAVAPRSQGGKSRICYPPHGCFSNVGNFEHMKVLPEAPSKLDIAFRLYQSGGPDGVDIRDKNVSTLSFNSSRDVYVLVHGFGNFPKWILPMKDELIRKDVSVIIVDWTAGSHFPNYYQAASNTRIVGSVLADMLTMLVANKIMPKENIALVGFSLGAHVCGFAGKKFANLSRIIALDPAGPLFAGRAPETRLHRTDANFVQCIHTNGLSFIYGGLGTLEPMGHLDFYANGGLVQFGCALSIHEIIIDLWRFNSSLYEGLTCSHGRAAKLFTETVRRVGSQSKCEFKAIACESTPDWFKGSCFQCAAETGMRLPMFGFELRSLPPIQGQFYFSTLGTREDESFCGSQYGISVQSDRTVKGTLTITVLFKSGLNDTFAFLSNAETLEPASKVVKLFALTEPFSDVDRVLVLYERYSSWLWASGPPEWVMNTATVTSLSCSEQVINIGKLIVDKVPLEIRMSNPSETASGVRLGV